MSDDDDTGASTTRTRVIMIGGTVLLLVGLALVIPRFLGGTDDESPTAGGGEASSSASPSSEPEPSDAPPPGQAGDDGAGAEEGGTGSGQGDSEEGSGSGGGSGEVNNQPPLRVGIEESAQPTDELRVSVTRVEEVRSQAELPGETSRPALRLTVRVDNLSDEAVPIGNALTNLYYGPDRLAATLVQRPGGRPFPASVAPGGSASSVVVYNVPRDARGRVALEVSMDATVRRVEFRGDCAGGC